MNWNEALMKALKAFHKEYGENAPLPDGGKFAVVSKGGVMIISSVDGEIEIEIVEKIYQID